MWLHLAMIWLWAEKPQFELVVVTWHSYCEERNHGPSWVPMQVMWCALARMLRQDQGADHQETNACWPEATMLIAMMAKLLTMLTSQIQIGWYLLIFNQNVYNICIIHYNTIYNKYPYNYFILPATSLCLALCLTKHAEYEALASAFWVIISASQKWTGTVFTFTHTHTWQEKPIVLERIWYGNRMSHEAQTSKSTSNH